MSKRSKTYAIIEIGTGFIDGWYFNQSQDDLDDLVRYWDEDRPDFKHMAVEIMSDGFRIPDAIHLPSINRTPA